MSLSSSEIADQGLALSSLFEVLPGVCFFVKDAQHRFVLVNAALARLHGRDSPASMNGLTDHDLHPPDLAARYVEEDRLVMTKRRMLRDQPWLVPGADRLPHWYLSTKVPLLSPSGEAIGLAGVLHPYEATGQAAGDYQRLLPLFDLVRREFHRAITVPEMAAAAGLSVSQLQREFRRLFQISPRDYLARVRLDAARRRLEETGDPVGRIALDCGYYDQSHFTRTFRDSTGLSPLAYRRLVERKLRNP